MPVTNQSCIFYCSPYSFSLVQTVIHPTSFQITRNRPQVQDHLCVQNMSSSNSTRHQEAVVLDASDNARQEALTSGWDRACFMIMPEKREECHIHE